jgi:hypothetical protein
MYNTVNWDSKLPPKLHAPVTTYENGMPDPLRPKDNTIANQIEKVDQRPAIWQVYIPFIKES